MEKFARSSEHKKISDIDVNLSTENTKQNLQMLKTALEIIEKETEARAKSATKIAKFENIQMASNCEESDITIDNAHRCYEPNISSGNNDHFDPISDSLFRRK